MAASGYDVTKMTAPEIIPMRIWRYATMWEVMQGEVTDHPEGWLNRKVIWEPLETHAPQDSSPYCCYLCTIIFYDWNREEITRVDHYDLNTLSPSLLFVENQWWEVAPGQVVWRNDRWYFMHVLDRNSRHARRANLGMYALRSVEEAEAEEIRRRNGEATVG
jgi:hypothetical protein